MVKQPNLSSNLLHCGPMVMRCRLLCIIIQGSRSDTLTNGHVVIETLKLDPLVEAQIVENNRPFLLGDPGRESHAHIELDETDQFDTAADLYGEPEMDDDWVPPHRRNTQAAEQ